MSSINPCRDCIGKTGQGEDCCIDVYIILNPEEVHLFRKEEGYIELEEDEGGVYYTKEGCPYLDKENSCTIHNFKPLYCKYYPIFITGNPFADHECPANSVSEFSLSQEKIAKIRELQEKFPVYKKEWFWADVRELTNR